MKLCSIHFDTTNKAPHVHAGLRNRRNNRSGVIYIAILSIATLVMIMALGALLAARSLSRASSLNSNSAAAADYAYSALEVGRWAMANDQYWRTDCTPGVWFTRSVGSGNMSLNVSTADSTFSNMTENLVLLGTGTCDQSTQKIMLTLHSTLTPLSCLASAIAVNGAVNLNSVTIGSSNAGLVSNTSVTATGNTQVGVTVSAPAGTVSGGYYQQLVQPLSTQVVFPNLSNVFATYLSNGTRVSYGSLTGHSLNQVLVSPLQPPQGNSANASGIYVIDCGGGNLSITNCRIVGTLVVLNANSVTVSNSVIWEPALADYPCLLVQGNANIQLSKNALKESSGNINYNPLGTPYPYLGTGGVTNSNTTDTYPSGISGLVYVSGNLTTNNDTGPTMGIVIVGGTLRCSGQQLTASYDSSYYSNPPPGFYSNTLTADSNAFQRSVN